MSILTLDQIATYLRYSGRIEAPDYERVVRYIQARQGPLGRPSAPRSQDRPGTSSSSGGGAGLRMPAMSCVGTSVRSSSSVHIPSL